MSSETVNKWVGEEAHQGIIVFKAVRAMSLLWRKKTRESFVLLQFLQRVRIGFLFMFFVRFEVFTILLRLMDDR